MDADPTTGMLVGETQTFPEGVHYDQYRIGGTSLSSPLFAGVMALADQAAGGPLGFANPLLYKLARDDSSVYFDVVPQPLQALVRSDFVGRGRRRRRAPDLGAHARIRGQGASTASQTASAPRRR